MPDLWGVLIVDSAGRDHRFLWLAARRPEDAYQRARRIVRKRDRDRLRIARALRVRDRRAKRRARV